MVLEIFSSVLTAKEKKFNKKKGSRQEERVGRKKMQEGILWLSTVKQFCIFEMSKF